MKGDVNGITLIADIVLYFSPQYEQEFPPILIRAMSFGIPIVAPDYPVIKKYVSRSSIVGHHFKLKSRILLYFLE